MDGPGCGEACVRMRRGMLVTKEAQRLTSGSGGCRVFSREGCLVWLLMIAVHPLWAASISFEYPIVCTRMPANPTASDPNASDNPQPNGPHLVLLQPGQPAQVLTGDFYSAGDPRLSFSGERLLFAAQRQAEDAWNIYEMTLADRLVRQITRNLGDCRMPCYQSTFYTIDSPKPWYQITFVRTEPDYIDETYSAKLTRLYSCRLDGSEVRGLTYNLSSDLTPTLLPDGRVLYSGWQRSQVHYGPNGRLSLFHINSDGSDGAAYALAQGKPFKRMPCVTTSGLVVFVESDALDTWDGAGTLGAVLRRRPLHSYRPLSAPEAGLFHSPSDLPDGRILVSRRSPPDLDFHHICALDAFKGTVDTVYLDSKHHCIQAQAVWRRPEPDGRSSVVTEKDPHGKFYCLNVYMHDLAEPSWLAPGTVKRLRVLEGIPMRRSDLAVQGGQLLNRNGLPRRAQRRILGEIDVARDGSFNIEVPANLPVELQILDQHGMALRTCSWIWAKNHEPRGCIGCHEDGELTPENTFVQAVQTSSIPLTPTVEERRTVDFSRDLMPIIEAKCSTCHRADHDTLPLTADSNGPYNQAYVNLLGQNGRYVRPGQARNSFLMWSLFGRGTTRPWDTVSVPKRVTRMPPAQAASLTQVERRTFIEWVDLGALWDGIPGSESN